MKHFAVGILFALALSANAQTPIPMTDPALLHEEDVAAKAGEIVGDSSYAFLGAIAGNLAGMAIMDAMWDQSYLAASAVPGHYVFDTTTGMADYTPATTAYSPATRDTSPGGILSNGVAGTLSAATGALIGVGVYELGHRVFKWW